MKRAFGYVVGAGLSVAASVALAGGMNPGPPPVNKIKLSGPTINGTMVVDTHTEDSTTVTSAGGGFTEEKGKLATIWLQRGGATASAVFRLPVAFAVALGCDTTVTNARFGFDPSKYTYNSLYNWMPNDTVNALLQALGVTAGTAVPVVTTIASAACTADPENPTPSGYLPGQVGILSFQLNIQFAQ